MKEPLPPYKAEVMLQKARGRFELLHRQQPYRGLPGLDRTWLLAPLILADNEFTSIHYLMSWYKQTNVEAFILININHLLKVCLLKGPTNIAQCRRAKVQTEDTCSQRLQPR